MYGAYRIRVSFGVLLSRDFSRLPQMKSLLSGYCSIRNFNAIAGPPVFECKFKKKQKWMIMLALKAVSNYFS